MMKVQRIKPRKELVDQISEVLAQNKRILAMNETVLRAILNPPRLIEQGKIDMEELLRDMPQ